MTTAVATMRAVQVAAAGGDLRIIDLKVPDPGPEQVRIKVQACGVCRSDAIIVEGRRPGIPYPRVPGHEVAGVVDALGNGVTEWRIGQRVGVGWHGGHDGTCPSADAEIIDSAAMRRIPVSTMTAAIRSTCWLPSKR
jgi:D-arabinose 1-dehydrogenase-like Zn-dependent alcohol dehydrogenase